VYIVLGTVRFKTCANPLFLFWIWKYEKDYGVAGAAIASVITQGLSAAAGSLYFFSEENQGIKIKIELP